MKVVGEATARGSVETVWGALHDAALLARAIPGCEHFEVSGPGIGQFVASTALPAIGGTYAGSVTIAEQQRPSLLRLTASATGNQGTMTADVTVRLSEAAGAGPGRSSPRASGRDAAWTDERSEEGRRHLERPDTGGSGGSPPRVNTVVSYEANGTVTGSIAGVGTRLLASAAKRLADEFFAGLDENVAVADEAFAEPAESEQAPRALARPGPPADNRTALIAGAAIGLAGVIIGVLAGRRRRKASGMRA